MAIIDQPAGMPAMQTERLKRLAWFFALWLAGVATLAAIGLLVRLLLAV